MEWKRALRWSAEYLVLTSVSAALGLGLIAAGLATGGFEALDAVADSGRLADALDAGVGWLALTLVGLLVWRLGTALALHRTLTGAVEERLAATYNTERVKSEMLEVLDERLAEMQNELESLEFAVEGAERSESTDAFEFGVGDEDAGGTLGGDPEASSTPAAPESEDRTDHDDRPVGN
jgi:hypothetical protein